MPADFSPTEGRFRYRWLAAAVLGALALEGWLIALSPTIAPDGVKFIRIAQQLTDEPRATMQREDQHPGYPAMTRAAATLTGAPADLKDPARWILAAQLVSAICGLGAVVVVWLLARRTFDERTANVAAVLFAALPMARQNAADALSDTPHLLFYLLACWLLVEGFVQRRALWFAAAGAASGIAFWIRPEGLSVAIVAGFLLCLWWSREQKWTLFARGKWLTATAAAAVLIAGPYVILAGKVSSKKDPFAEQQKPATYAQPFFDAPPSLDIAAPTHAEETVSSTIEAAPHANPTVRPESMIGRLQDALVRYVEQSLYAFNYILLIALACGHFAPGRARPNSIALAVLVGLAVMHTALLLWLHMAAGYISHRHVLPLVGIAMPCTASGVIYLVERGLRLWGHAPPARGALVVTVGVLVLAFLPLSARPAHQSGLPVVEAARWIKSQAEPDCRVLSNSLYVPFYSGLSGPVLGVDAAGIDSAAMQLESSSFDFIVLEVDLRRFTPPRPDWFGPNYALVRRLEGPERKWRQVNVYARRTSAIHPLADRETATIPR